MSLSGGQRHGCRWRAPSSPRRRSLCSTTPVGAPTCAPRPSSRSAAPVCTRSPASFSHTGRPPCCSRSRVALLDNRTITTSARIPDCSASVPQYRYCSPRTTNSTTPNAAARGRTRTARPLPCRTARSRSSHAACESRRRARLAAGPPSRRRGRRADDRNRTTPVDLPEDPDQQRHQPLARRVRRAPRRRPADRRALPRRQEARALLGSLLRPYSWTVTLPGRHRRGGNTARLSVPILVQRGIDHGVPPIIDDRSAHTLMIVCRRALRGSGG